jgi:hypothetical protein
MAGINPFFSKSSSGTVQTGPPVNPKVVFLDLLIFLTKEIGPFIGIKDFLDPSVLTLLLR